MRQLLFIFSTVGPRLALAGITVTVHLITKRTVNVIKARRADWSRRRNPPLQFPEPVRGKCYSLPFRIIVAPSFRAGASSSRSICWSGSKPCSSTMSRACARRSRRRGPISSLHNRRIRRVIRSSACGLDPATGGLRFSDALAADQEPLCRSAAKTGLTQCRSQSARGPSAASGNGGFGSISSA